MKCSQTGKQISAKVRDLSTELEDGSPPTLKPGNSMLLDLKGKTYPVEFVSDVSISMCMMMGLIKSSSCTQGQTKAKRNKKDIQCTN